MSLQERLNESRVLNANDENKITSLIKDKIKNGKYTFNTNFESKSEFKDKLFVLINNELENLYPSLKFFINNEFVEKILSDIFGLGILEKYLQDKDVTDIFIQDKEMIIIKNGLKTYLGEVFDTIEDVYLVIDRIKTHSNKIIDQRVPFLNTDLYEGSRCSIVIPPVSDKVYISIRIFNCLDFSLEDLLKIEMFDEKIYLTIIELINSKKNIIISGAMGSGKTTLLNTMAKLIPRNEFINIIQDTPEIRLKEHPYVRLLTTRPRSREIDNEISQDKLLFETLRMKADRIIIGEVRDSMAAYQMLQALNTGHNGSFSTIHADSSLDALLRLETLALEYKPNLNSRVIKKIISRSIDTIIFLENEMDANSNIVKRRIKEIALLEKDLNERGDFKLIYL
ncbi:Flp pilus assembly complex ATPase component TadA [bacterium]|nr:Flp pilus assembly complex ATPase component TadA [bacterium]